MTTNSLDKLKQDTYESARKEIDYFLDLEDIVNYYNASINFVKPNKINLDIIDLC